MTDETNGFYVRSPKPPLGKWRVLEGCLCELCEKERALTPPATDTADASGPPVPPKG